MSALSNQQYHIKLSKSLREARLVADVERVIVAHENKSGAVKIVVVARENKSKSLREAR